MIRSYSGVVLGCCLALAFSAPAHAAPKTYAVQAGDSLWTISAKFGSSVARLEARNKLTDASILQIGQILVVGETPVARPHRKSTPTHRSSRAHSAKSVSAAARATASRIVADSALWAATHDGTSLPSIAGVMPFAVAQAALAFDARITGTALRYLGVPYSWGGTSFGGVDCSGFVWAVFAKNGIALPRTADAQFDVGHRVTMPQLMPGDLVFFQTYAPGASHVGIYLGAGKFVHASSYGVRVDYLGEDYFAARYIGARRLAQG